MSFLLLPACSTGSDEKLDHDDAAAEAYYAAEEAEDDDEGAGRDVGSEPGVGGDDPEDCPAPACISLAEGVDRGMVTISMGAFGDLEIANGGDLPVCVDRWYTFLSSTSQDAVGGETTSLQVDPGETEHLSYGEWGDDAHAWWCIEEDQYTSPGARYTFNGAEAPELLQSYALDEWDLDADGREDHSEWSFRGVSAAQSNIWEHIDASPVVIVGRDTNYFELTMGDRAQVEIEVINLGRVAGSAVVEETVPVGQYAGAFTVDPVASRVDEASGATTYTFDVTLPAAVDPQHGGSATYGVARIGYELTYAGTCAGREIGSAPSARWTDANGDAWTAAGAEMVIECCSDGGSFGD